MSTKLRRRGADAGSMSVEMAALVFPVTLVMAVLLVAVWQLSVARHQLQTAAATAARAASLQTSVEHAAAAADDAARRSLADADAACTNPRTHLDPSGFSHGGHVEVVIECHVPVRDLIGLPAPGAIPASATGRAPLDTFIHLNLPGPTP